MSIKYNAEWMYTIGDRNQRSNHTIVKNAYLSIDKRHCNPVIYQQSPALTSIIIDFLHITQYYYRNTFRAYQ